MATTDSVGLSQPFAVQKIYVYTPLVLIMAWIGYNVAKDKYATTIAGVLGAFLGVALAIFAWSLANRMNHGEWEWFPPLPKKPVQGNIND